MIVAPPDPQARRHESQDRFATVDLSGLRVGAKLRFPLCDVRSDRNVLLLAAGTTITRQLLERLEHRGIRRVRVNQEDLSQMKALPKRPANGETSAQFAPAESPERPGGANGHWAITPESFVNTIRRHGSSSYSAATTERFVTGYRESIQQVESLFTGLATGGLQDAAEIAALSSNSLMRIAEDLDLFVATGLSPATDKYPCRHSLQTAMLAMSIATTMGHAKSELVELGIGCLMHDAGMLHVDAQLLRSDKVLDRVQFLEITKHPAVTFDMLKDLKNVPSSARLVAYQMHERLNGTGYPRQRHAGQIHPFSKIAAVADVFVALISPRPHRPGMLPYHAVEELIRGARNGLFDGSVVRALLHTVSLFPIGSCVELNDGRVGRVVRANGKAYTRPVVELWAPEVVQPQVDIVDLAAASELAIVRPVAEVQNSQEPDEAEVRFQEDFWE
jgi:HD-GYP domain-containing protein (c-di-GMP phosphodiesterase class II)